MCLLKFSYLFNVDGKVKDQRTLNSGALSSNLLFLRWVHFLLWWSYLWWCRQRDINNWKAEPEVTNTRFAFRWNKFCIPNNGYIPEDVIIHYILDISHLKQKKSNLWAALMSVGCKHWVLYFGSKLWDPGLVDQFLIKQMYKYICSMIKFE